MRNYRIAFFTVDWNYDLVESTLHGLKRFVDSHENVNLFIFDCFGKDLNNAKDRSEYAIFDLPDLSLFDGLLIQGNQIILNNVREAIARKIEESGIPAVTIDCPIEGCALLTIDNAMAQHDITEHLIHEHNARSLVYLTGMLNNGCPEGKQRLDGFMSACQENRIDLTDIDVIPCTWRTTDGIAVAEQWIAEGKPLPDAFVCANDEMALGLIEGLGKHGIKVPDDVLITGFDNITSAELSRPRLSTVRRDYFKMNYRAMECLIARIDGTETRDVIPFEYDIICSESCGCHEGTRPDYFQDKYFQQTRLLKSYFGMQEQMAEDLFDASNLQELMNIVERHHRIFGCDNVFLCINDYYFDNYEKKQWRQDSERFGKEMVLAACGKSHFMADESHLYARFPTRRLLPDTIINKERFLVFYPLHYNTYSIGYIIMDGISQAAKLNLHESIFSFLEIAIENVRKKCLLRQLNDVLDNLYVHDALTGLYNRFGFDRYGKQVFDDLMAEDGGAQVLFVDMDDMKRINDQFGHDVGDAAICAAANILRETCGPQDFIMRYGGDEFLMIASSRESELIPSIDRALDQLASSDKLPCRLSLSIGGVQVNAHDHTTLDRCIRDADARMYDIKTQKKTDRAR